MSEAPMNISRYCGINKNKYCLAWEHDLGRKKCLRCLQEVGIKEVHYVVGEQNGP